MASQSRCEVEIGYFVSLSSLRALLTSISTPPRRWWVDRVLRASIVVGYSNPVYVDLPNSLKYEFPVMERSPLTHDESWVLILLHPVAATQRAYGLYFEGDGIKQDPLADWEAFWTPLQAALVKLTSDPYSHSACPPISDSPAA